MQFNQKNKYAPKKDDAPKMEAKTNTKKKN